MTDTNVVEAAGGTDTAEPVADGPDTDGGPADIGDQSPYHDLCQQSCDVTSAVPCPDHVANCVALCETMFATGVCVPERRAYDECKVAATSAAFVCVSPPGATVLMPSFCRAETNTLSACLAGDAGTD